MYARSVYNSITMAPRGQYNFVILWHAPVFGLGLGGFPRGLGFGGFPRGLTRGFRICSFLFREVHNMRRNFGRKLDLGSGRWCDPMLSCYNFMRSDGKNGLNPANHCFEFLTQITQTIGLQCNLIVSDQVANL